MIEMLTQRGVPTDEAEAQVIQILQAETEAEKAARLAQEAAAERRRIYEEQQRFIQSSPMNLPGMGARVRSGKRKVGE